MKIALVCSHGGHLSEMLYMKSAFENHEVFFITYESSRTNNLAFKTYTFPNFGEKPLELLKNLHRIVFILIKEQCDLVISNGAEIAIPFFYLAKLLRKRTLFMECYTRISDPTLTGRIVYPVSDQFIVLWPELLDKYGKKARYIGKLFKTIINTDCHENERSRSYFCNCWYAFYRI